MNGNLSPQMTIFLTVPSLLLFNQGSQWIARTHSVYSFVIMMASIIVALALPHIIITVYDIIEVGLVNPDRTLAVLGDEVQRSVTQRTVELSMCIGSIGLVFHTKKESTINKKITVLMLLFAILASLCALHYVSRTGVVIILISVIASVIYEWRVSLKTFFLILIAIVAFMWLESTSLFVVYSARETVDSNISNFGLRLPRWEWAWNTMISHPWGDSAFMNAEHPYAHNFWLDIGKTCGFLPFILMSLFSIVHLVSVWKILSRHKGLLALLVIVWTLSCYISLFTEPIHEGAPAFMFVYFLYCGVCYKASRRRIDTE